MLVEPPRPESFASHARLRRIVRENHSRSVNCIAFNSSAHLSRDLTEIEGVPLAINLVATAGGPQANIYDSTSYGDHLDLVSQFSLAHSLDSTRARYERGTRSTSELLTCCWIPARDDALLACAGTDKVVHVFSVARSAEIARLEGHDGAVAHLAPHPTRSDLLLSLSTDDDTLRLWHLSSRSCLAIFYTRRPVNACFNLEGIMIIVGDASGHLRTLAVLQGGVDPSGPIHVDESARFGSKDPGSTESVVSLSVVSGRGIVAAYTDGEVVVRDVETGETTLRFVAALPAGGRTSRVAVSYDGTLLALGHSTGRLSVHSLFTGAFIAALEHPKRGKPVTCAAFSQDGRTLICGSEDGTLWRYDLVSDQTLREWDEWTRKHTPVDKGSVDAG